MKWILIKLYKILTLNTQVVSQILTVLPQEQVSSEAIINQQEDTQTSKGRLLIRQNTSQEVSNTFDKNFRRDFLKAFKYSCCPPFINPISSYGPYLV